MDRIMSWAVEIWEAVRRFFAGLWGGFRRLIGLDRLKKDVRKSAGEGRSMMWRILYVARPVLALLVLIYVVMLTVRFSMIHGDDLGYPQVEILAEAPRAAPGEPIPGGEGCAPSAVAAMNRYILDVLVNQNVWAPGDPQYKFGYLGIKGFEGGPFWDNKASFQIGAMRAVRRISIELVDLLGRARGTSAADPDLQDARGAVQWNERAWILNPFDNRNPLLSTSASASYRSAMRNFENYNAKLAACDALYDSRSDNLFQLLDRIANDIGGMTDQLASRSKGERWDVNTKQMVPADGNNSGFFDFRADNLFFEAHGMMWAYHGILQAVRADFNGVITSSNLNQIWNRMEGHVAETASLEPLIVSNGKEDSLFQPDHLSAMAANMLRARANMTEIREVLNR
jgi:hypothetical protein